jgi:hypothetical protein
MYHLYLDESGETGIDYQNKDQPYFCISGFIIKEEQLSHLEANIQILKKTIGMADDQEIHAKEIGDTEILSLLYENLWPVIEDSCIGIVNTGFNKVEVLDNLLAFDGKRLMKFSESKKKIIPYIYGAYKAILKYTHFLKDKKALGMIFFDEKQEYKKVKEIFNKFANKELLGDQISWDMVFIDFLKSSQSSLIQLADVLAYTFNRANVLQKPRQECLSLREETIMNAYSAMQKYIPSDLEFDIGGLLPAVLENEIFKKINTELLR